MNPRSRRAQRRAARGRAIIAATAREPMGRRSSLLRVAAGAGNFGNNFQSPDTTRFFRANRVTDNPRNSTTIFRNRQRFLQRTAASAAASRSGAS